MKHWSRFIALFLTICMLLSIVPAAQAEEGKSYVPTDRSSVSRQVQTVNMKADRSEALSQKDVKYYQQMRERLRGKDSPGTVTVENDDTVLVYSLKQTEGDNQDAVLEEYAYSQDASSSVPLVSYSEITLSDQNENVSEREKRRDEAIAARAAVAAKKGTDAPVDENATALTGQAEIPAGEGTKASNNGNSYHSSEEVRVTAEQLLNLIKNDDQMAYRFARSLGFGNKPAEQIENLTKIVEEYKENPDFTEPAFVIKGVNLNLAKSVTEETEDDVSGFKTKVDVDSSATVEIVYDNRGQAKVVRKIKSDKPTDFIIALDVSGSMGFSGGRDKAMFSALKVVLNEILQNPENTVSIVFWADNATLLRLDVNEDGITETTFSGADGYTSDLIYKSPMVAENGNISNIILAESYSVISQIENFYHTSSGTEPDKGLDQALALLEAVERSEGRNLGVMLFTDGEANYTSSERRTVANEKELAEKYGAKIVNVSIGSEYQVQQYGRYLNPQSPNYYEPDDELLKERVLYYNIPQLTNEELAQRVTEMFDVAFEDITSETHEMKSETITTGILAAAQAKVIEQIPSGFQVLASDNLEYTVEGIDEDGNTLISFNLDDLISQNGESVAYFVVPTEDNDNDIGLTAYTAAAGTTLYAEPVDKILDNNRSVSIVYSQAANNNQAQNNHPQIDRDAMFRAAENQVNNNLSKFGAGKVDEKAAAKARFRAQYRPILKAAIKNNINNPLRSDYKNIKSIMTEYYKSFDLNDTEIQWIFEVLENCDDRYRMLYLCSLPDYAITGVSSDPTSHYSRTDKKLYLYSGRSNDEMDFKTLFFHESGHAIQLNLWGWESVSGSPSALINGSPNIDLEKQIQAELKEEVKTRIGWQVKTGVPSKTTLDFVVSLLCNMNPGYDTQAEAILEEFIDNVGDWNSYNDPSTVDKRMVAEMKKVFANGVPDSLILTEKQKETVVDAFFTEENGKANATFVSSKVSDNVLLTAHYQNVIRYYNNDEQGNFIAPGEYRNSLMVYDISGGVTNNKLGWICGHTDPIYWYNDNLILVDKWTLNPLAEGWAEYYSAKTCRDQINIDANRDYFPESTRLMEELAGNMYDYYIGLYQD